MTLSVFQATITNENGDILPGAEVSVILESTGLAATIYSTRGGAALSNPFFADASGFAQFYSNAGEYRIVATSGVFSRTWRYVRLGDGGAKDVGTAATKNTDELVTPVNSVADLDGFAGTKDDQQISLKGWHPDSDVGGGILYWDAAKPKSEHNGGTVFSPTVPFSATTGDYLDGVGETDVAGNGCWVRTDDTINAFMLGAVSDGATDITGIIEKAATYLASKQIDFISSSLGYIINTPVNVGGLTCVFHGENQLVGTADLNDVNGIQVVNGVNYGYPFSPELRGKQVEIVCGTIRAQQDQDVVSFTSSGAVGTIVQNNHGYNVGEYVVVTGATEFKFIGTFQIDSVVDTNTYTVTVESSGPTTAVGTLKVKNPGLWEWIKDAGHEPIGVDDSVPVRTDGTGIGLTINFLKNYSKVLSVVAGPDETIAAAQGLVIGSSVATNAMQLRASVDKTLAARILWDGSKWVVTPGAEQGKIFTDLITYSTGNLTIPHSFCPGRAVICMPDSAGGTVGDPLIPLMKSPLHDKTIINFLDATTGAFHANPETTRMSFSLVKNYSGIMYFDGRDRSGEIGLHYGNIWFFGIMQL